MTRRPLTRRFAAALAFSLALGPAFAAERKAATDVSMEALTAETQRLPDAAGVDHLAMFWWVPFEFWEAVLAQDTSVSAPIRNEILDALRAFGFLAVAQADISSFGGFDFYGLGEVRGTLRVEARTASGTKTLVPATDVPAAVTTLMSQLTPILTSAMGNMGENMHFFVFDDPPTRRVFDPYSQSSLSFTAEKRDGTEVFAMIEGPLDSLHIPRMCPNGKPAHISWRYCPWSGKKLPE